MFTDTDRLLPIALLALGATLAAWGLLRLALEWRRGEDQRLRRRLAGGAGTPEPVASLWRRGDPDRPSLVDRLLSTRRRGRAAERFLAQADVSWPLHRIGLGVLALLTATALGCAALDARGITRLGPAVIVLLALSLAAVPLIVLTIRRARRLHRLTEQLPDAFELLGQALRAGHSLTTGLQLVGEQMPAPAGGEFARVFHEQNFGVRLEDALSHLAERVGLLDVRMFVTAVVIQRQTGGDLAEVLDKSGAVIRDRIKLAGAVKALTAEGRLSGWVLTALPIVVGFLVWRLNPGYMAELYHGEASYLLKIAVVLHVVGFLAIQRCTRVKY